MRGKVVVHIAVEVLGQKAIHHAPDVGRTETLLLQYDVLTALQRADDAGIGGRPPDAVLLQRLDQCRLGVTWWRLGEVLLAVQPLQIHHLPHLQRRQQPSLSLVLSLIGALLIDGDESRVRDGGAGGTKAVPRTAVQVHGHGVDGRMDHLAGDRALPDQLVEAVLLLRQVRLDLLG